ncbi:hypothetical protein Psal006b_03565 (plasmid) [Piscirickettsia salmonis]|uniref:Prevent-host-death protein n=1 Tax=Piscirickettsia salmonis TaxID=1238 RepID=A0A1L6TIE7_PISSA|nr:hypothetical protein [Piscirickettsia salmonis]ALB24391.1 prevent-host-death protein [Piscirickettsia salmonis]ALT18979.1 hypothetical protein PSLF89_09095 [Piscirickettsia salmonis LF-89 = ATCC VR-1361]ALY04361.1 hypothetical protein AWE47_17510 [Piscirickettsia salmonis]AMA44049.1 hypothetical protein AWJ11_16855 [Piscirickettsia salmonis]AMA44108.1 hypothetical protein AWJ11_17175 [Piscirickettsia salmonis]
MKTAMLYAFEQAVHCKKRSVYQKDDDPVLSLNISELHKNLKDVVKLLDRGVFIELQKHNRKIGMIVPY